MKYIDADRLKAEINKHIGRYDSILHEYSLSGVKAKREEAFSILTIIESLHQEQPQVIDDICSRAGIPVPFMDGNQWSILKGDNIQVGVVGFGDTKEDALVDFIKNIPIQQDQPDGIIGVVHHAIRAHWIVADEKQLATALKEFPEGTEVEFFIYARKV